MRGIKMLAAGLLLLLGAQGASAQLYLRDSDFGTNTVVVDTRSGLSWLQLSQSQVLNYADFDVPADYSPATGNYDWTIARGVYAGYRVAAQFEVDRLIDNYVRCPEGPSSCGAFIWSDETRTDMGLANRALDLIELFGGTLSTNAAGLQEGIMGGAVIQGGYPAWGMFMRIRQENTANGVVPYVLTDHYSGRNLGTFLVAPVPEPSTYALMICGLVAVGVMARRRKNRDLAQET